MNLSLPQVRLIAVLALAAGVLSLGGMFFILQAALLSDEVESPAVVHRPRPAAKTAPATQSEKVEKTAPATKTKPAAKAAAAPTVSKPAAKAAAAPTVSKPAVTASKPQVTTSKPKPVSKPEPAVLDVDALPRPILQALRANRVVVVALVVPGADLDALTAAEAEAGAKKAGAGFVSLNILRNAVGRPLAEQLGIVETPAIAVYRRPKELSSRFEGFADRETIAQAAASARSGG